MKSRTLLLIAMALVVGLASCKKDDPSLLKPTLVSETKDIHSTYAEFTWSIEFPGMFESGVELSLNEKMSDPTLYQGTQSNGIFKVTIENLMPATKYYFRYVVWNPVRRDELGISSFMTEAGVPQPTTDMPVNVTQSSATLGGVVSNDGGTAITACGICWGTEPEPTINDNHIDIDVTMKHFTVEVTGLVAETKYYVRTYATNRMGTGYGNEVTFFTGDVVLPQVVTVEVKDVEWTTAVGVGEVTSDGGGEVVERGFCWSSENHTPDVTDSHVIAYDNGIGSFEVQLTGLAAGTTYYCRAYARNQVGYEYGEVRGITTNTYQLATLEIVHCSNNWVITTIDAEVVSDGGSDVMERGVCWSTSPNPEYSGAHLSSGTGTGAFTVNLTGLNPGITYHVRAYAINSGGTAYSDDFTFTTLVVPQVPLGAINGLFSVSESEAVWFSQGNLQYQAFTDKWQFAERQYDCVGENNESISSSYSGWIDLFGWGTSGWNSGAVCYQPWSISTSNSDYYPGGSYTNNLTESYANADWGVYNAINNGGNQVGQWRTLTDDEWTYVFKIRNTFSGIRYAKACVNGVNGVILLPDDWNTSTCSLSNTNNSFADFTSNTITAVRWTKLENAGAVFLPAAGGRVGTSIYNLGSSGYYWSASYASNESACGVFIDNGFLRTDWYYRHYGLSVRLVRDVQ